MSMSAEPSISAQAMDSRHVRSARRAVQLRAALISLAAFGLGASSCWAQSSGAAPIAEYSPPTPLALNARAVRDYAAPEADQGVAVDGRYFYAVDNTTIVKYEIETGTVAGRWAGPRGGLIRHLNSCLARGRRLWCANSNYPLTPMGSSIEVFDARTMAHVESRSLGMTEEGSLTWFDRFGGGWIAGFAHYDGNGGVDHKDHRFSSVVTFDNDWRRTGGWLFPQSVLERIAPHAASGGAVGPDGLLYVLGHDRPELYVLARPAMGSTLVHVATIAVEAEGQAFSWSPRGRQIYAVDRRRGRVLVIDVPSVDLTGFADAERLDRR